MKFLGIVGMLTGLAPGALIAAEPNIRVAITPDWKGEIVVEGDRLTAVRRNGEGGSPERIAGPSDELELSRAGSQWTVDGHEVKADRVEIQSGDGRYLIKGRIYQGGLDARSDLEGKPRLVLTLPLENYLLGVVSHEVDPSWTGPLLRTQAVLARTYALRKMLDRQGQPFDVEATTQDQVFGGLKNVNEGVEEAVNATRGEVVLHQGEPIQAFYHSTCGGHTENAAEVFLPLPYAQGKPDVYCLESPRSFWKLELTKDELADRLKALGIDLGRPLEPEIIDRDASGRVATVMLKGPDGFELVLGKDFRRAVSNEQLRSANFEIREGEDGGVKFLGTGSGHGVGLCQWGAKVMAEKGYDYKEIIGYYYEGVTIGKNYE